MERRAERAVGGGGGGGSVFEWEDAGALNDSDEARGSGGGGGLFEWDDDENGNTTDPLVLAERGCAGGGGRSTAFEWDEGATSDCGGGGRGGGAADAEFEQNFGAQCAAGSATVAASSELLSQAFLFGDGFSKRDAASSTQGLAHSFAFDDEGSKRDAASSAQGLAHRFAFGDEGSKRDAASSTQGLAHSVTFDDEGSKRDAASSAQWLAHSFVFDDEGSKRDAASSAQGLAHCFAFGDEGSKRDAASSTQGLAHSVALDEESSKKNKVDWEMAMELESHRMDVVQLREELSAMELEAANLAARFLGEGGALAARSCPKLQKLLADAQASVNLTVKDEVFLEHFLKHIAVPNAPYCEFVSAVASHYANVLGMQEYLTLASLLRMPKETWIKARRRIVKELIHVGTMFGQFDLLSMSHDGQLYVAGSDATRVTAMIEAEIVRRGGSHLSGECYSPNPLEHKQPEGLDPIPVSADELRSKVERLHEAEQVAVNVELTSLNCATDPTRPTTVVSAYPAARSGYKAIHRVIEWATWRYWATHFRDHSARALIYVIYLVGAATDSCGAELAAGLYAGTPNEAELDAGYLLLGLDAPDYLYFAKYFWFLPFAWCAKHSHQPTPIVLFEPVLPFFSRGRFGDWDHALRTGRRNLHNPIVNLAFGSACFATWGVIQQLKDLLGPRGNFLHSILKFNSFMEQSSDDSRKLFDKRTIGALREVVDDGRLPDGAATLLFLMMVNFMFMPMVEPNFGDPFQCTRSMWTGLYIMRLWRAYVRLSPGVTLVANFVSLEFYNTCEAMIHGGTNWYLIVFRHRGKLPWHRAAPLRLVADTRPQESIFSQSRVGKFALNSVNATFKARCHDSNAHNGHLVIASCLLPLAGVYGYLISNSAEFKSENDHEKHTWDACSGAKKEEPNVGNQSGGCAILERIRGRSGSDDVCCLRFETQRSKGICAEGRTTLGGDVRAMYGALSKSAA